MRTTKTRQVPAAQPADTTMDPMMASPGAIDMTQTQPLPEREAQGAENEPLPSAGETQQTSQSQPVTEERIRELAYYKWQMAGQPEGDGVPFWLAAEAEIYDVTHRSAD